MAKLLLSIGLFVGFGASLAFAYDGDLVLPDLAGSSIALTLQQKPADIDPSDVLQVFVGKRESCCDEQLPIAGRYTSDGDAIVFEPAFEFIEGQPYTVLIRRSGIDSSVADVRTEFQTMPTTDVVSATVDAFYPSGSVLPENTLRFYIHFSTPMQPHVSADYIKLVDRSGKHDNAAFMSFKQELWSQDRKRLTLLMDPGRIKRGVAQNRQLGPALLEGTKYAIVIEEGWLTADGSRRLPRFERSFLVSESLRTLPDTGRWRVEAPRIDSQDSLHIRFDRSYDHALLKSSIQVLDTQGQAISGVVFVEKHETSWRFQPAEPWSDAQIEIVVNTRLEDVAGNNLIELFDRATEKKAARETHGSIIVKLDGSQS